MGHLIIFSLVVLIILLEMIKGFQNFKNVENFETFGIFTTYDCVISINIHENIQFLLKQLENIKQNVKCSYLVILNCNDTMHYRLKSLLLPSNVVVHNIILNKKWEHGSLEHGIYNNLVFATKYYKFRYFICCSSRNFFANNLKLQDLNQLIDYSYLPDEPSLMVGGTKVVYTNQPDFKVKYYYWHWPTFFNSKLGQYCIANQYPFYVSPHEGLVFSYDCCFAIINFLDKNPKIQINLFNLKAAVEEFGLQTIAKFSGHPFYYIGNGCCNENMIPPNNPSALNKKFMYKVKRI